MEQAPLQGMSELRGSQEYVGGEERARQKEQRGQRHRAGRPRQRLRALRPSVPGSSATLGPLRPASPPGPVDQCCTQVLAGGPREDLWGLVAAGRHLLGLFLGCGLGVGAVPGGGDRGSPSAATPPARHLPEKILFPALPSTAAFSPSPRRASGPVCSSLKAGPRLSASPSSPVTGKGPVRGFSEGTWRMQFGLGSGSILNQSNAGSLSESPCVDARLLLTPIYGAHFLFQASR